MGGVTATLKFGLLAGAMAGALGGLSVLADAIDAGRERREDGESEERQQDRRLHRITP